MREYIWYRNGLLQIVRESKLYEYAYNYTVTLDQLKNSTNQTLYKEAVEIIRRSNHEHLFDAKHFVEQV